MACLKRTTKSIKDSIEKCRQYQELQGDFFSCNTAISDANITLHSKAQLTSTEGNMRDNNTQSNLQQHAQ
jgi:hypothetical protein